ncbi:MAG: hypothetical protein LLG06_18275, partial [Desulfobacteraceae bacterium]|nr:hypothetical protein [Desulfobacteraceae bacterium]
MLIDKGNKDSINIEFLLHHGPNHRRVGVLADSMFSVIIGFDVKGHRVTSPLLKFWGPGTFFGKNPSLEIPQHEKFRKTFCPGFPSPCMLTPTIGLSKWKLIRY